MKSKLGWVLLIAAYLPTTIFTAAVCHFVDNENWIAAGVFFTLVLLTLPRFKR